MYDWLIARKYRRVDQSSAILIIWKAFFFQLLKGGFQRAGRVSESTWKFLGSEMWRPKRRKVYSTYYYYCLISLGLSKVTWQELRYFLLPFQATADILPAIWKKIYIYIFRASKMLLIRAGSFGNSEFHNSKHAAAQAGSYALHLTICFYTIRTMCSDDISSEKEPRVLQWSLWSRPFHRNGKKATQWQPSYQWVCTPIS